MKRLGRYQLEQRLAGGTFGEVWRATLEGELGFRKPVAVKVFKNAAVTPSLENEAQIGARLHHPNVVDVYEFGAADGQWFLAMELLDGPTLEELVRDHPTGLDPEAAVSVVRQVAQGLAYAHGLRDTDGAPMHVIHRDLKPANVIQTTTGVVKILDFGIALFTSASRETEPGRVRGTPHYLSPEQAEGAEPTAAVDLWALGAIACELATGAPLVPNGAPFVVLTRILSIDPARVGADVAARVPALGPIVEQCLQSDPLRRPTAAEVARILGAATSGLVTASTTTVPRRSRAPLAAVALAACLGVALAAYGWWPTPGGTLAVGIPRERGTLDAFGRTRNLSSFVLPLVIEKLTEVDSDGVASPVALASVTSSDDDRVWTLTVRSDRSFHPGPCTGEGTPPTVLDLVYSIEAAEAAEVQGLGTLVHPPGADHVELHFEAPSPFLPNHLALVPFLPHQLDGCDPPGDLAWPVGTGPYRFEAAPGERLELVRNPGWVPRAGAARPTFDRLVFRSVQDDQESYHLLADGTLHAAELALAIHEDPPQGISVVSASLGPRVALKGLLALRNGPHPLDDAGARRALSAAIPRELVSTVEVRNPVEPDTRFLLPRWLGYEPALPDDAGDLAALQGHGPIVVGAFEGDRAWADAIGAALVRRGVAIEVVTMSFPSLEEATRPGGRSTVDLVLVELHGESFGSADPWPFLDKLVSNLAVVSYVDGGVREAMRDASVRDRTARRAGYRRLEELLVRDVPFVPLGWVKPEGTASSFAVRPELRGFAEGGTIRGEDPIAALVASTLE